jgi:hypothetical protein
MQRPNRLVTAGLAAIMASILLLGGCPNTLPDNTAAPISVEIDGPDTVIVGTEVQLKPVADPTEVDGLAYTWSVSEGAATLTQQADGSVRWTPGAEGPVTIVLDASGVSGDHGTATYSTTVAAAGALDEPLGKPNDQHNYRYRVVATVMMPKTLDTRLLATQLSGDIQRSTGGYAIYEGGVAIPTSRWLTRSVSMKFNWVKLNSGASRLDSYTLTCSGSIQGFEGRSYQIRGIQPSISVVRSGKNVTYSPASTSSSAVTAGGWRAISWLSGVSGYSLDFGTLNLSASLR